MVLTESSRRMLFFRQPLTWGHSPVMIVERDGVQMGELT